MVEITGRWHEQKLFDGVLSSSEAEFIAVYGRRRVGKTFLIREYFKGKGLFFELTGLENGTLPEQLANFSNAFAHCFSPSPHSSSPSGWSEALEQLRSAVETRRGTEPIILFFDELPWIAGRKSGFLHALEYFWNHWASRNPRIKLIVCGSAASWMLDKLIYAKGGLHNRLTHTIKLMPFNLGETASFLKTRGVRLDHRQILELYIVMGGVPHYLKQVRRGLSAAQNIDRICFSKDGLLSNEFGKLYASLFENAPSHVNIIRLLAKSRTGMTREEIIAAAHLTSGGGTKELLRNLEEAGFIEGLTPFGRELRGKIFRITDEYSLFYQKWITTAPPSLLKEVDAHYWMMKQNSRSWETWSGLAFEGVCLKHVQKIKTTLGIGGIISSNSAWRHVSKIKNESGAQIDLLIDRMDKTISVCEIKFSQSEFVITKSYAEELRRKLSVFKQHLKVRKNVLLTMITPYGTKKNSYYHELVASEVVLEDLF